MRYRKSKIFCEKNTKNMVNLFVGMLVFLG